MRLNPPWLTGIEWRRMTLRDGIWLAQFLARSLWQSAFGVAAFPKPARPAVGAAFPAGMPKRIWMYWRQGWDSAPELVRLCRRSWEVRNPGWEVVAVDHAGAEALTGVTANVFPGRTPTVQAYSNALRLALLADQGGVWVDATTFCLRPLDDWLPAMMPRGFVAFSRPCPQLLASTWFLAAERGNYLINAWDARYRRFWRLMRVHHRYWVMSFLFTDLCRMDREAASIWRGTPALPSDAAGQIESRWDDPALDAVLADVQASGVPMLKLNWRLVLRPEISNLLRGEIEAPR